MNTKLKDDNEALMLKVADQIENKHADLDGQSQYTYRSATKTNRSKILAMTNAKSPVAAMMSDIQTNIDKQELIKHEIQMFEEQ